MEGGHMIFAEDIVSAVSRAECEALCKYAERNRVLEVGSHYGRSTIALASVAWEVVAVDWHRGDAHAGHGDTLTSFMANLRRYGVENTIVIIGRWEKVYEFLAPSVFDVVFLDAFHERDVVLRDLLLIRPLVKRGGHVLMHDYEQGIFGSDVKGAAEEFVAMNTGWDGPSRIIESLGFVGRRT